MRRQVTVGGLVALALLSGSVVAQAAQPAPPAGECVGGGVEGLALDEPDSSDDSDPAEDPDDSGDSDDPASDDPGDADDAPSDDSADDSADEEPSDEDSADDAADDSGSDDSGSDDSGSDDSGSDDSGSDDSGSDDSSSDSGSDDPSDDSSDEVPADGASDDQADAADDQADAAAAGASSDGAAGEPSAAACAAPTAAEALGWGTPALADEFDGPLGGGWRVYSGTGFDGQGTRTAEALSVSEGVLTITGDAEGNTGGMAWSTGQEHGRWEARVRTPAGDPSYNPVLLLWPDDPAAAGQEIDFLEVLDPTRQTANAFVHPGGGSAAEAGEVAVDGTAWHTWAVEWTPTSVTTYVDGAEWWRLDDPALLPSGPMHLCVQLDWFPTAGATVQESSMQVDWVRQYALPTTPATTAPAPPADAATPADATPAAGTATPAGATPPADTVTPADATPPADPASAADTPTATEGVARTEGVRLAEGAPDLPARPGIVGHAVTAPRG